MTDKYIVLAPGENGVRVLQGPLDSLQQARQFASEHVSKIGNFAYIAKVEITYRRTFDTDESSLAEVQK